MALTITDISAGAEGKVLGCTAQVPGDYCLEGSFSLFRAYGYGKGSLGLCVKHRRPEPKPSPLSLKLCEGGHPTHLHAHATSQTTSTASLWGLELSFHLPEQKKTPKPPNQGIGQRLRDRSREWRRKRSPRGLAAGHLVTASAISGLFCLNLNASGASGCWFEVWVLMLSGSGLIVLKP